MTATNISASIATHSNYVVPTSVPAYNNMITNNPFIISMQQQAVALGAQYRQMHAMQEQLKQQVAAQIAQSQLNNNATQPLSGVGSSSIWTQRPTSTSSSSSYINFSGSDSELKPGLFKGALAGKEALVTRLCRKYGVSPALVASIIGLESGWGTSNLAMHNNFGGVRKTGDAGTSPQGFGYFSSVEKGLEEMIKNLASYSRRFSDVKNVDFANLDAIGRHYCDASWAPKVREMYNSNVRKYIA